MSFVTRINLWRSEDFLRMARAARKVSDVIFKEPSLDKHHYFILFGNERLITVTLATPEAARDLESTLKDLEYTIMPASVEFIFS